MGVSFVGFSQVLTKPIPKEYRATVTHNSSPPPSAGDMYSKLISNGVAPDEAAGGVALARILMGVGVDQSTGLDVKPSVCVVSGTKRDEYVELMEGESDFITVHWETNMVYYKSEDTVIKGADMGYYSYGVFIEKLCKLKGGPLAYTPPCTDSAPEDGIVSAKQALLCLSDLQRLRERYMLEVEWDEDIDRFEQFYDAIAAAADGGILCVT